MFTHSNNTAIDQATINILLSDYNQAQFKMEQIKHQLATAQSQLTDLQAKKVLIGNTISTKKIALFEQKQEHDQLYQQSLSLALQLSQAQIIESQLKIRFDELAYQRQSKLSEYQSLVIHIEQLQSQLSVPAPAPIIKTGRYCENGHENCPNLPNNAIRTICINQAEISAYQNKVAELQNQIANLQRELNQIRDEFSVIDGNYQQITSEYESAKAEEAELKEQTDTIDRHLEENSLIMQTLQMELYDLESEYNGLENQLAEADYAINTYQQELRTVEAEINYLSEQLSYLGMSLPQSSMSSCNYTDAQFEALVEQELALETALNEQQAYASQNQTSFPNNTQPNVTHNDNSFTGTHYDYTDAQFAALAEQELALEAEEKKQRIFASQNSASFFTSTRPNFFQENNSSNPNISDDHSVDELKNMTVSNFAHSELAAIKSGIAHTVSNLENNATSLINQASHAKETLQEGVSEVRTFIKNVLITASDLWPSAGITATKLIMQDAERIAEITPEPTGNLIVDYVARRQTASPN